MKKKWMLILILVLIALIARVVIKKNTTSDKANNRGARGMQVVPVETGKVETMHLDEVSVFSGSINPRSFYIVTPKVSGQLKKLYVNMGQNIHKGQLIAELDDRLFREEFEKAKAAVDVARANAEQTANTLAVSQDELNNKRELLQKSFVSQAEFNNSNAQFVTDRSKNNIAQASLKSALAAMNSAEIQLSFTKITADWSDNSQMRVIGERFTDEGTMLNAGTPIVSLMDINSVIVVIDVIEKDYTKIKNGQVATITSDSYPDKKFFGKVVRIAPVIQETSRQARVEIEVPNPKQILKPGMFVKVSITYQTKKNALVIPAKALTKLRGKDGVYQVNSDSMVVHFNPVKTGLTTSDFIEILSPSLSGEVVTLGQDMLDDGRRISLSQDVNSSNKKRKQRK